MNVGSRFICVALLLSVASCKNVLTEPELLTCYQSGTLKINLRDNDKIITGEGKSGEFRKVKRKAGWFISSKFMIMRDAYNEYRFVQSEIGEYEWNILDSTGSVIKIVSEDGVPFYFGRCLEYPSTENLPSGR